MVGATAEAELHGGVPIQVHAYIAPNAGSLPMGCRLGAAHDASTIRVRDGKVVEIMQNEEISAAMQVEHVYYRPPGIEQDVMERTLSPMIKATVEGVNTAVLAIGSLRSTKDDLLWQRMNHRSLAEAIFLAILTALDAKATAVERGPGKNRFSFSVCVSFVQFYEENVTDLLSATSGLTQSVTPSVDSGKITFAQFKDVVKSPTLRSSDEFRRLLELGRQARRTDVGLYGNAIEFSSLILRLNLVQTFEVEGSASQELRSTLDIVDLPPTDRLTNLSTGMPRMFEGALLNKSLFAVLDCTSHLSDSAAGSRVQPPFNESSLTQFLRDSLSGNCLSFGIVFLVSNDANGSRASIQLAKKFYGVRTFPVVNNDVIRGLHFQHFNEIRMLKRRGSMLAGVQTHGNIVVSRNEDVAYTGRIHELEGRVAQEALEKRLLREDKEKIAAVMNELKAKYQQLFDNEIEIRKELLTCEQEKLALSKAFVEFQMEKNAQLQDLDSEKFELESKLIQAEEMIVQIQQDDEKKASQIHDLCLKIKEVVNEKRELGEQLSLLQRHSQDLELKLNQETKKNQQLSLEFVVLVNQRQKMLTEVEGYEQRHREVARQLIEKESGEGKLLSDIENLKEHISSLEGSLEATRRDLIKRDLDIEHLQVQIEKAKVECERKSDSARKERETEADKMLNKVTADFTLVTHEKAVLTQQLHRVQEELEKRAKENDKNLAAWMAGSHEIEDLRLSHERLQHENQVQLDEFRLKLSLIGFANDGRSLAVTELVQSYQRRERELKKRAQNALSHKRLHRLRNQFGSVANDTDVAESVTDEPYTSVLEEDLRGLTERLHEMELKVVKQLEVVQTAEEEKSQYQQVITSLRNENEQLKTELKSSRVSDQEHLEAINKLQSAILQQLEEIRGVSVKPALFQHLTKPTAPQPLPEDQNKHGHESSHTEEQPGEKLASNQLEWAQSVEDAERRCASLMTKNVMLTEENEQLRQTLKSLLAKIHARR